MLGIAIAALIAASPAPSVTTRWTASWVAAPDDDGRSFGVFNFRRRFKLNQRPSTFRVRVTADPRYELFVNGVRVSVGPASSDPAHRAYDTVDLSPQLRTGDNVVAATVFNFGEHQPWAQMSARTAFLLQGDTPAEAALVDTGTTPWRVARDAGYRPHGTPRRPVDVGEELDGARHPWTWQTAAFDDGRWVAPTVVRAAAEPAGPDDGSPWGLVARTVPMMEERPDRLSRVRRATGVQPPAGWPAKIATLAIPPRTRAVLLLDRDELTTAFPELTVSQGRGARVQMRYAESLHAPGKPREKGARDQVEGKELTGMTDLFWPDGGARRTFRPLLFRTYRYIELSIHTARDPLILDDLTATFTAYPFERRARFDSDRPELAAFLDVGWRTARLCAHETYMDCPYYEQLQYVGDTRIQALVSLYTSGDDRLMRNALVQLDASRNAQGLTASRYPSSRPQVIPPFSLWWIGMLHDHWTFRGDSAFVRSLLPGVRAVMAFFQQRQLDDGRLGPLPWWNFVDWAPQWPAGVPPGWSRIPAWWTASRRPEVAADDPSGASSILDLQLLLAFRWTAALEEAAGSAAHAAEARSEADRLTRAIRARYWDESRKLFADAAGKTSHSQHANVLAVLADVVTGADARALMQRVMTDSSITTCTIYFRAYLSEALARAGLGDQYLDTLGPWREMLGRGLTTWAEHADPVRSDCHAWGASPNVDLFRIVLGVSPAAPGFARVRLAPAPGALQRVAGTVPHPRGQVTASFQRAGDGLDAAVELPAGVSGEVVWAGRTHELKPGHSQLRLPGP